MSSNLMTASLSSPSFNAGSRCTTTDHSTPRRLQHESINDSNKPLDGESANRPVVQIGKANANLWSARALARATGLSRDTSEYLLQLANDQSPHALA